MKPYRLRLGYSKYPVKLTNWYFRCCPYPSLSVTIQGQSIGTKWHIVHQPLAASGRICHLTIDQPAHQCKKSVSLSASVPLPL